MMRALWTAASGMTSQQMNVDTISNNLSNVNTTAYKKERMEFKSLLYQTMKTANEDPAHTRPVNLQVGHGVRPIATARAFTQGNVTSTGSALDLAIDGQGFFAIQMGEDNIAYTKDGSFKLSVNEDGEQMLVTSEGYPLLDVSDTPINIPEEVAISSLQIDRDGNLSYINPEGDIEELDIRIDVVQFSNVQGLEAIGGNLFKRTPASGEPIKESEGDVTVSSGLIQGFLERSNVSVADEMVDLIVAQRAYELNSKAIQTADDMLQNANNLKR